MKILILCDHYSISPRVKKIRNSLIKLAPGIDVKVFAWNRNNRDIGEDYVFTYDQNIGYGNKLHKLLNMGKFTKSAKVFVDNFKPDYIHAIDIEMLISSKIISKESKIVYEVYDIKFFQNKIINWMREKIEFLIINKYVEAMVLASPYFGIYYKKNNIRNIKTIVMNNKPERELDTSIKSDYMDNYKNLLSDKIVIGFIGTVRYQDILTNLIDASARLDNLVILIAGDGPSSNYIKDYIKENSLEAKVIMTGRYNIKDLECIYGNCDYIWAAYPNRDLNVKYAISNKFFESMVYGKKMIVSEKTMLGNHVKEKKLGFTVDPYDVEKISNLLGDLEKHRVDDNNLIVEKSLYWEDEELRLKNIYKL